jgi:hypothetical protein
MYTSIFFGLVVITVKGERKLLILAFVITNAIMRPYLNDLETFIS